MSLKLDINLVYLPPYSPDKNPIEEAFGWVKSFSRRNEDFFSGSTLKVLHGINLAISSITPELALSWIQHSGYGFHYE